DVVAAAVERLVDGKDPHGGVAGDREIVDHGRLAGVGVVAHGVAHDKQALGHVAGDDLALYRVHHAAGHFVLGVGQQQHASPDMGAAAAIGDKGSRHDVVGDRDAVV